MNKLIISIFALCAPYAAIAAGPSLYCPSGYISVKASDIVITSNTRCPSDYPINIGTATSCLASNPGGSCIMYAPAGVSYTDATGTYEYTEACAME